LRPFQLFELEQLRRRPSPRLILEIDIRELLPGVVNHNKGGTNILDRPGRREAAKLLTKDKARGSRPTSRSCRKLLRK
jgi:hypothetical protein